MLRTTIETQESERYFNYYDAQSREDYGVAIYPYETLRFANEIGGDCRRSRYEDAETGSYRPCANVMPLVNERGQADAIQSLREDEIVDACELNFASHIHIFNKITLQVILTVIIDKYCVYYPVASGYSEKHNWYIPKGLATEKPMLLSYFGIGGEDKRRMMAELFKRPTTWGEYCQFVSVDNCSTSDDTAVRAPIDESEGEKYFVDGLFTGYFRATEKNDCDSNPKCTGHFVIAPW